MPRGAGRERAQVVPGEASESEDEEQPDASSADSSPSSRAFVIAGEAPESDEESTLPASRAVLEQDSISAPASPEPSPPHTRHNSLLHEKLWENNVRLRSAAEGLLRHTSSLAVSRLTEADKMLLNAQESMRSTNASLGLARARLRQLRAGLEKANCSSALPTVKTR